MGTGVCALRRLYAVNGTLKLGNRRSSGADTVISLSHARSALPIASGMVFLQVMRAGAEIDVAAIAQLRREGVRGGGRDQRARIAREQHLRIARSEQCRVIALADGVDIGRLARDRQFTRQREDGSVRLRRWERRAVSVHRWGQSIEDVLGWNHY